MVWPTLDKQWKSRVFYPTNTIRVLSLSPTIELSILLILASKKVNIQKKNGIIRYQFHRRLLKLHVFYLAIIHIF